MLAKIRDTLLMLSQKACAMHISEVGRDCILCERHL